MCIRDRYRIGVSGEAKDLAGNGIEVFNGADFTTGEEEDTTTPAVISTEPSNGDSGVALNKIISVTFSEEMDPATINSITITLKQGTTSISVSYTHLTLP